MRVSVLEAAWALILIKGTIAQLNLGSFNLFKNPYGDLQLALGQGGSIFGYGTDRGLQVTVGPGRFGTRTDNGVVLGGERVGVDSQLGVSENQGLNLGSLLRVGNNGGVDGDPLGSMLRGLGSLFQLPPNANGFPPGGLNGRAFVKPSSRGRVPGPLVGPTLLPGRQTSFPSLPNRGGDYGSGEDKEVPLSVGRGWDGEEEKIPVETKEVTEETEPDGISEVSGPLTAQRILPPTLGVIDPNPASVNRVTTEGRRKGSEDRSSGNSEGRHDGGTGEFERIGKLPIPDGLEMISTSVNESRKH